MSMGSNLQFLRKQKSMTQEQLADTMQVSRQTVSKWESDTSFPEMEKLLQLCDLFGCTLDGLTRGNLEQESQQTSDGYDRHFNRFTAQICCGVGLVLLGVTMLLVLSGIGMAETLATMIFLAFVVAAVTILIVSAISHENFVKENPVAPAYPKERIAAFNRKFPFLIAIPTAMILIGVIWTVGIESFAVPSGLTQEHWEMLLVSVFLFLITIAVPIYIYAGMQKEKYDSKSYNRENAQDPSSNAMREKNQRWGGVIMLSATAVFLLLGFCWNLWQYSWVAFPIGGILCAIVSCAIGKSE